MPVDLSLYLVTDSTPAILKSRDLCYVVEEALKGGMSVAHYFCSLLTIAGVTIVQYRDKKSDTAVQVETAKKLHQITRKYNVPLLINDRVDVAVAAGVEGVHLGQDDMSKWSHPVTSILTRQASPRRRDCFPIMPLSESAHQISKKPRRPLTKEPTISG